jgi:hypothetical protein
LRTQTKAWSEYAAAVSAVLHSEEALA